MPVLRSVPPKVMVLAGAPARISGLRKALRAGLLVRMGGPRVGQRPGMVSGGQHHTRRGGDASCNLWGDVRGYWCVRLVWRRTGRAPERADQRHPDRGVRAAGDV